MIVHAFPDTLAAARAATLRMTLTCPALNRARRVLWLVTGDDKPAMLARLRAGDRAIPAARIRADQAEVFADGAAARDL